MTSTPPPFPVAANVSYQFGTRSIIGVMAGVAVLAAVAGPFARGLDRDQALGICVYLGAMLVIATLLVVGNGWKRRRMESVGGPVRYIFRFPRRKRIMPPVLLTLAFLYAFVGVICIYSRGYVATAPLPTGQKAPPQLPAYFLVVQAGGGGFFLGVGLGYLLARSDHVQFRESGIIVGWHYVPWNRMSRLSWSWKSERLHLWGVARPHFELAITDSEKNEVDAFLRERILGPSSASGSDADRVSNSEAGSP